MKNAYFDGCTVQSFYNTLCYNTDLDIHGHGGSLKLFLSWIIRKLPFHCHFSIIPL